VYRDKDSIIGKAKAEHTSKSKYGIYSLLSIAGRCTATSGRAGLHHE